MYGKLVYDTIQRISRGIAYPAAHEDRVSSTLELAIRVAAASKKEDSNAFFRILEVGMGNDCRVIRRGLYQAGLNALTTIRRETTNVEIVGVDLKTPKYVTEAQTYLDSQSSSPRPNVNLKVLQGDIQEASSLLKGQTFDVVISCLTLCSVQDPRLAVEQMYQLVRPNGGTLAYIEHVAATNDNMLEFQQELLDPIQQKLADNCHLHRYTEETIESVFTQDSCTTLSQERFRVPDMWPVSCQTCGVLQRNS